MCKHLFIVLEGGGALYVHRLFVVVREEYMCKHLFLVIRGRRGLYKCEHLFKVRMLSTQ